MTVWGDDVGITWENADEATKGDFALTRLFWYYRMVQCGGPDGSELDTEVEQEAREAAEWYGPVLAAAAAAAERRGGIQ